MAEIVVVGVWWTEIVVVGVDRDSDDGCLDDRLWQWIFGGQIVVVVWTEIVMVGVWWTDCGSGCFVDRTMKGLEVGMRFGCCCRKRLVVDVWWTEIVVVGPPLWVLWLEIVVLEVGWT